MLTFPFWWGRLSKVWGGWGGTKAGIISAHATIALHTASANGSATGCFGSENKDSPPPTGPPITADPRSEQLTRPQSSAVNSATNQGAGIKGHYSSSLWPFVLSERSPLSPSCPPVVGDYNLTPVARSLQSLHGDEFIIIEAIKTCQSFQAPSHFTLHQSVSATLRGLNLTVLKLVCDCVVGINMELEEGASLRAVN